MKRSLNVTTVRAAASFVKGIKTSNHGRRMELKNRILLYKQRINTHHNSITHMVPRHGKALPILMRRLQLPKAFVPSRLWLRNTTVREAGGAKDGESLQEHRIHLSGFSSLSSIHMHQERLLQRDPNQTTTMSRSQRKARRHSVSTTPGSTTTLNRR